jgi:hypothetical protein
MNLPLGEREVSRIAFTAGSLWLEFWGQPDYFLHLEGVFRLIYPTKAVLIDPAAGPSEAYLSLVAARVSTSKASDDGSLDIVFADGRRLEVSPAAYEPWQLTAPDGFEVVSVAGGGLAVWDAQK